MRILFARAIYAHSCYQDGDASARIRGGLVSGCGWVIYGPGLLGTQGPRNRTKVSRSDASLPGGAAEAEGPGWAHMGGAARPHDMGEEIYITCTHPT